jgi:hypothetical protein
MAVMIRQSSFPLAAAMMEEVAAATIQAATMSLGGCNH